jgi:hypothetical protein
MRNGPKRISAELGPAMLRRAKESFAPSIFVVQFKVDLTG